MGIRKRIAQLEADNEVMRKRLTDLRTAADNCDRRLVQLETRCMELAQRLEDAEVDGSMICQALHVVESTAAALGKRLDELEPAIEQYKVSEEEAAAYEKTMNDGMASIFGYVTPGMRGNDHGGR